MRFVFTRGILGETSAVSSVKSFHSCRIHTLMSSRMMRRGKRPFTVVQSRGLIKSMPPSSLAFSAFLRFSFRHFLARSLFFLSTWTRLPTLSFALSRHPLLYVILSHVCDVYARRTAQSSLHITFFSSLILHDYSLRQDGTFTKHRVFHGCSICPLIYAHVRDYENINHLSLH